MASNSAEQLAVVFLVVLDVNVARPLSRSFWRWRRFSEQSRHIAMILSANHTSLLNQAPHHAGLHHEQVCTQGTRAQSLLLLADCSGIPSAFCQCDAVDTTPT